MSKENSVVRLLFGFSSGYNVIRPHVHWVPPVDIYEYTDKFLVIVELPGVNKEDIDITLKDNILKISGYKKEFGANDRLRIHQMEISYGYFERVIQVFNVDESNIKAEFKDGILFITILKY